MINSDINESYPTLAGNSPSYFPSVGAFILPPRRYVVIDGVLYDDVKKDMRLGGSIDIIFVV